MKEILFSIFVSLSVQVAQAQGELYIGSGTTLYTNGSSTVTLHNTKLTNNGNLTADDGTVVFTGNSTNAQSSINGTGTTAFKNVTIDKTANGVQLNQNVSVSGNLTLTGTNKIVLGNATLSVNAITGGSASAYIVTDGTGSLIIKGLPTNAPTTFPIGSSETSYDPLSIRPTNSVDFTVKVKSTNAASDFSGTITQFNRVVPRQWDITPTGAAGSTVLTFTNGGTTYTPSNPKVGHYTSSNVWEELPATYSANVWTATTTSFSPFGVGDAGSFSGISLAAKVFLEGPYASATGKMKDDLRSLGLLSNVLTEPFTTLNYTHYNGGGEKTTSTVLATTGNDAIIDWVLVELRDATTPSTVLSTRSGLLQADGDIVDVDGISPLTFPNDPGTYHVAIKHRLHLATRTATAVALNKTVSSTLDFTTAANALTNSYKLLPKKTVSDPNVYGLYMGDGDRNGYILTSDINAIRSFLNTTPAAFNYFTRGLDLDMNGYILSSDINNCRLNLNKTQVNLGQ